MIEPSAAIAPARLRDFGTILRQNFRLAISIVWKKIVVDTE
jgi:hypothetical protein